MSEAEKVNGATFTEWFNFVDAAAFSANQNETNLPELSDGHPAVKCDVAVPAENSATSSWSLVANWMEAAEKNTSPSPEELVTLFNFIQDLRGSNTKLIERVIQLEQSLKDSQNELHRQRGRSRDNELKLAQKIQAQEQVHSQLESLSYELDTAEQTIGRQKVLIETLTDDLNTSQERIAQMERECALVQSRYNEQSYQLMQVETSCRDLRSRLQRQQRYTMQLKAALEKCAEPTQERTPEPNSSNFSAPTLFPNPQPITPWSIQSPKSDCTPQYRVQSSFDELTLAEDFLSDRCSPYSFNSTPSTGSFELPNSNNTTQILFAETDKEVDLDDFFSLLQEEAAPEAIAANSTTEFELDNLAPQQQIAPHSANESATQPDAEVEAPSQPGTPESSQDRVNPNWPSPVVYPLHPPKGRKSLASIELPKFPPKQK